MPRTSKGKDESVRVVVRCRPMNEKEVESRCERVVDIDIQRRQISIHRSKSEELRRTNNTNDEGHNFFFDSVYDWSSKQKDVYEQTAHSLVESVLEGFNGTIFAYGQTGTGKTFTMEGVRSQVELRGIIPSSFAHIFDSISHHQSRQFLVRASYLEIYNENIRDLLARDQNKRLQLQENPKEGVQVQDLSSFITKNVQEIEHVMTSGNLNRATGATNMNEHSSRSHAIFIITVESSEIGGDGKAHIRVGKLNLVDLAGSERQSKTGATGDRFKEATNINLSLSVLGNVISALVDGNSHIPYRDSKLTRLLQNSLGGNSKTIMIATMGPADYNYEESLTTLRYANRAKNIKNQPRINEDPKDALLRKFQDEIARLKQQLEGKGRRKSSRRTTTSDGSEPNDDQSEELYYQQEQDRLDEERRAIAQTRNLNDQEREMLLKQLEEKNLEIERQKSERQEMLAKIQQMESKLITGGKDLVTHTQDQEEILYHRRQLIVEAERRQREAQRRLQQGEEEWMNFKEKYTSIKDEVDDKRLKRDKLMKQMKKLSEKKQEINEKHRIAREELEVAQREIQRQLKLQQLIIENFIPHDERQRLIKRIEFDEQQQSWTLTPLTKQSDELASRPRLSRRPDFYSISKSRLVLDYLRNERDYLHQLDPPVRNTQDYEGPLVSPIIQAAMKSAMKVEESLEFDANTLAPERSKKNRKKPVLERPFSDETFFDLQGEKSNRRYPSSDRRL